MRLHYGLSSLLQWYKSGINAVKPNNSEVILHLQENDICHRVMGLIQPEGVKDLQPQEEKGSN